MGLVIIATGHRHRKDTTAAGLKPIAAASYDANLTAAFQTAPYDARVAKGPPPLASHNQNPKLANVGAGLGCQRGNVATKSDARLAIWRKTLRHHFSYSYDVNLARNRYDRCAAQFTPVQRYDASAAQTAQHREKTPRHAANVAKPPPLFRCAPPRTPKPQRPQAGTSPYLGAPFAP